MSRSRGSPPLTAKGRGSPGAARPAGAAAGRGIQQALEEEVPLELGGGGRQQLAGGRGQPGPRLAHGHRGEQRQGAGGLPEVGRAQAPAGAEQEDPPLAAQQPAGRRQRLDQVGAGAQGPLAQGGQLGLDGLGGGRAQGRRARAAVEGDEGEAVPGAQLLEHPGQVPVGGLQPGPAVAQGGVEQDGQGQASGRVPGRGRPGGGGPGAGQGLQVDEAVLFRRELRRPLPGRQGQAVREGPQGIAEGGQPERLLGVRPQAQDQVAVQLDLLAGEGGPVRAGLERQPAGRRLEAGVRQADPHREPAGHRRLGIRGPQHQAELAPAADDRDLLLELQFQPLGGQRRDRRHRDREQRAGGARAGAPGVLLLALLEQPRVDGPAGQLLVDRAGPLPLQDHRRDALEAVPDGEVAHGRPGRQGEPVGALLDGRGVVLEHLADVDPGVAAGDPHRDVHLPERQHGRVRPAGTGGHHQAGLGPQRRARRQEQPGQGQEPRSGFAQGGHEGPGGRHVRDPPRESAGPPGPGLHRCR